MFSLKIINKFIKVTDSKESGAGAYFARDDKALK